MAWRLRENWPRINGNSSGGGGGALATAAAAAVAATAAPRLCQHPTSRNGQGANLASQLDSAEQQMLLIEGQWRTSTCCCCSSVAILLLWKRETGSVSRAVGAGSRERCSATREHSTSSKEEQQSALHRPRSFQVVSPSRYRDAHHDAHRLVLLIPQQRRALTCPCPASKHGGHPSTAGSRDARVTHTTTATPRCYLFKARTMSGGGIARGREWGLASRERGGWTGSKAKHRSTGSDDAAPPPQPQPVARNHGYDAP